MKASEFMATFSSAGMSGGFAPREESVNPNRTNKYLRIAFKHLPLELIPVQFADDAARIFCEIRDQYGFASSDMKIGCGDLLDGDDNIIGCISYNGRIWNAKGEAVETRDDGANGHRGMIDNQG